MRLRIRKSSYPLFIRLVFNAHAAGRFPDMGLAQITFGDGGGVIETDGRVLACLMVFRSRNIVSGRDVSASQRFSHFFASPPEKTAVILS